MKKQVLVSVDRGETRVALLEATGHAGAPSPRGAAAGRTPPPAIRVAELYLERRGNRSIVGQHLQGQGRQRPARPRGRVRRHRPRQERLPARRRDRAARRRDAPPRPRQGGRQEDRRPAQARAGDRRAGRQGPAEDQGRAPVDGPHHRRALHGLHADRRGHRRLQAPRRQRARAPAPRGPRRSTCTGGGAIVRTAASGAKREDFERELQYLFKLHEVLQKRVEEATAPELVFQEADLSVRVVRDIFSADFERALVDDEKQHHRLVSFFTRTAPELVDRVELYQDSTPLFEAYGVEEVIKGLISRRVDLPSRRLPDDRLRRGADGHRRQLRLVRRPRQAGAPGGHDHARRTSRRPRRSSTSCACATSAASSSSTSSTWRGRATATPC